MSYDNTIYNNKYYKCNIIIYYINTNEILGELSRENLISSHVKITCYFHMWKYHLCYGYIINRAVHIKKLSKWNGLVFHWCLYNKKNITWPLGDTKVLFPCWKNISRVSAANEWNIFSTLEEKFRISARPCNILYICNIISSDLLKALENHNDSADVCAAPLLGVTSYGVSMTTLEEVFLQLEDTSDETSESVDENEPIQVGNHSGIAAFLSEIYCIAV